MSRVDTCTCDTAHYERVELSPLHILGPGVAWRAAIPGRSYPAGHGFHFNTEEDAREYIVLNSDAAHAAFAFGEALADPEGQALVQAILDRKQGSSN